MQSASLTYGFGVISPHTFHFPASCLGLFSFITAQPFHFCAGVARPIVSPFQAFRPAPVRQNKKVMYASFYYLPPLRSGGPLRYRFAGLDYRSPSVQGRVFSFVLRFVLHSLRLFCFAFVRGRLSA